MGNTPIACGLYIKSDYPDILEDQYESYCGGVVVEWFISRMSYYNKLFKNISKINIPLKEDSITPLTNVCCYCKDYMDKDPRSGFTAIFRDHDHLNGKFRRCAHNKCNLQAKSP